MRHFSFLFLVFFALPVFLGGNNLLAQDVAPLSEEADISILTVGPGKYLYDKFGHTAVRVKDASLGIDAIFNYGSYDFNAPNFYTKFARGKLLYNLDVNRYGPFLDYYKRQNRWVKEQVLNLNTAEKQKLFDFLVDNAKPENKSYNYDFFFDNCATKPRDVLSEVLVGSLKYDDAFLEERRTFRELIQMNVSANSWGSLGMDVAIGSVVDKTASPWEHQFLPNYVYEATAHATINRNGSIEPLVKWDVDLFKNNPTEESSNFFTSPLFIFGLIGAVILLMTYRDRKRNTRSRYMDFTIFILTGLIGVVLLLLWFGTDHTATANNYNLLWAFPISILASFQILKKRPARWTRRFILLLILMLILLCIHWITGVQQFAIGFIPLFIALGVRYLFLMGFLLKIGVEESSQSVTQ